MTFKLTCIANYPAPIRLGLFILALLVIWLPFAIPISLWFQEDDNLVTILAMGLLYLEFLGLLRVWNHQVYRTFQWLQPYGLVWTRRNGIDLLNGLSIGLLFTLGLFVLEAILGWVKISSPSVSLLPIIAAGFLSALGIGMAEELFFRGWILSELERDYSAKIALWANALIFACLHFIKPITEVIQTFPQFPALILLGLTLVWARRSRSQRLGMSIGIHAGLVWGYYIFNVGKLLQYTGKVSDWVTGVNNNPLTGVMGIIFLGVLAIYMQKQAKEKLKF